MSMRYKIEIKKEGILTKRNFIVSDIIRLFVRIMKVR